MYMWRSRNEASGLSSTEADFCVDYLSFIKKKSSNLEHVLLLPLNDKNFVSLPKSC